MTFPKRILDVYAPGISRAYRRWRDERIYARLKREKTSFGCDLRGTPGLDESRKASGEFATFEKYMGPAEAVIDIGANVGLFTCFAAKSGKKVLAFEPDAGNLRLLLENLKFNKLNSVEVYPLALSNEPGCATIYGGHQGASLVEGWGGIRSNYSNLVASNSLDNLISSRFAGQQLLIKMDTEGHEMAVIRGSSKLLAMDPAPVWIIEHGLTKNFPGGTNPYYNELFQTFWKHGYTSYTADGVESEVTPAMVQEWLSKGTTPSDELEFLFIKKS